MEGFRLFRRVTGETGAAVVMITHDDRLAAAADRILLIEDRHKREVTTGRDSYGPEALAHV